jgi:diguanylate cyclase (GGDEF)-like protein
MAAQVSENFHSHLALHSTLKELFLYDFQLESSELGRKVTQAFEANPLLPGVILTERGKFIGMISRRRFLECMSRPFGLEVFSKRSLKELYQFAKTDTLIFPGTTSILAAAKQTLQRSSELGACAVFHTPNLMQSAAYFPPIIPTQKLTPDLLYEPIVVEIEPEVYRLLDVHQLLVAQSHIHELAIQLINKLYQQLEKANEELQKLATVDSLTQIANRRRFDEYLDLKWRQMAREQASLSLILCDIDFFKSYNDTYGHPTGDTSLQEVAQALLGSVKRPEDLVARYGGEEFAVILPNTTATGAVYLAEKMRKNIKALEIPHVNSTVNPYVTISLGVASIVPHPESSLEMLIEAADRALYQAKATGRDRYVLSPIS